MSNTATITQFPVRNAADNKRLGTMADALVAQLPTVLTSFFNHADEFLFSLAERPRAGYTDCQQYFDQMRVLRKQKSILQMLITNEMRAQLTQVSRDKESADQGAGLDELSLLDEHDLERDLAIASFASRAIEATGSDWSLFLQRIGQLTQRPNLKAEQAPLSPHCIGNVFYQQLSTLDFPARTNLMLFRLFDDAMQTVLPAFYQTQNDWLKQEGVLPDLSADTVHQPRRRGRQEAHSYESLVSLLAGHNQNPMLGQIGASSGLGMPGTVPSGSFGTGPMVDPALLSALMANMSTMQMSAAPAVSDMASVKQWTQEQAKQVMHSMQGTAESSAVALVAMLFEFILDDQWLSPYMKQLLARMQIPIIKVAMLDKNFFEQSEHSARRLLNQMARAANGWHQDANVEHDALYQGMEGIVNRLNHDFDDNLDLFDELLNQLTELLEDYRGKVEERITEIEIEETETFEQYQKADRSSQIIDALIMGSDIPDCVAPVLSHWSQLMSKLFAKQGESESWRTTARVAKELVWSVQPGVQARQRERFDSVVPRLWPSLSKGLSAVGVDVESMLQPIRDYHALYRDKLDESVWTADETLAQFEQQATLAEQLVEAPAPMPVDEPKHELRQADLSYYMDMVDTLVTEQWFDIEGKDGGRQRAQLSLIVAGGAKYVFTDAQGDKVLERSAIGLAIAMRDEVVNPVVDDPLFERMMDALVDSIGQ